MAETKKIGEALQRVHEITKAQGGSIVRSNQILRKDRELLTKTAWLQEIIKGWYMLLKPGLQPGDSTAWYANFWDFLRLYLEYHYGQNYCLSTENSLDLYAGSTLIPHQVIAMSPKASGNSLNLPFETSLLVYAAPVPDERITLRGLQVSSLPYALCKATSTYFEKNRTEAEIVLRLVSQEDLVHVISKYDFQTAAERLITIYKQLPEEEIASNLEQTLKTLGIAFSPVNIQLKTTHQLASPYVGRILTIWKEYRDTIIKLSPPPPGIPKDSSQYLAQIDSIYTTDAYNSLSIEGYHVTPNLIESVKNNGWNPYLIPGDLKEHDALAARGYFEAHVAVKESIKKILQGVQAGDAAKSDLSIWYQNLFSPMVLAGIIQKSDLFGYRKGQVFIRGSRHTPLPKEALIDAMETLFQCLKEESHPFVRALLGHYIFVFIHPYMDGNGRIGRFLMNAMLASGGYPWTVVQVKNRSQYIESLEKIHVAHTIEPFTQLIISEMRYSTLGFAKN